jgi:hypothetical protein
MTNFISMETSPAYWINSKLMVVALHLVWYAMDGNTADPSYWEKLLDVGPAVSQTVNAAVRQLASHRNNPD